MADADERDQFLVTAIPLLIGECVRSGVNGNWCTTHICYWKSNVAKCTEAGDYDDFGDRLIEMWEGRARG